MKKPIQPVLVDVLQMFVHRFIAQPGKKAFKYPTPLYWNNVRADSFEKIKISFKTMRKKLS